MIIRRLISGKGQSIGFSISASSINMRSMKITIPQVILSNDRSQSMRDCKDNCQTWFMYKLLED